MVCSTESEYHPLWSAANNFQADPTRAHYVTQSSFVGKKNDKITSVDQRETARNVTTTASTPKCRENVRGPRTGPRARSHLVHRAAKRRADTPTRALSGRVVVTIVSSCLCPTTILLEEHGRAAGSNVFGPRPEHAAGKCESYDIEVRVSKRGEI